MTPAERARQIDKEEFAAECAAIRQRALVFVEQQRDEERRRTNRSLGLPENTPALLKKAGVPVVRKRIVPPQQKHLIDGEERSFSEWACYLGLKHPALQARVRKLGSLEAAVAMGPSRPRGRQPYVIEHDGRSHTIKEWAEITGIESMTIHNRLRKGWSVADTLTRPLRARQGRPGVPSNFQPLKGTGAGSAAQAMAPENNFSGIDA